MTPPGAAAGGPAPDPDTPSAGGPSPEGGDPAFSDKPVLEWDSDDWARWIEGEPVVLPGLEEPEPAAGRAPAGGGHGGGDAPAVGWEGPGGEGGQATVAGGEAGGADEGSRADDATVGREAPAEGGQATVAGGGTDRGDEADDATAAAPAGEGGVEGPAAAGGGAQDLDDATREWTVPEEPATPAHADPSGEGGDEGPAGATEDDPSGHGEAPNGATDRPHPWWSADDPSAPERVASAAPPEEYAPPSAPEGAAVAAPPEEYAPPSAPEGAAVAAPPEEYAPAGPPEEAGGPDTGSGPAAGADDAAPRSWSVEDPPMPPSSTRSWWEVPPAPPAGLEAGRDTAADEALAGLSPPPLAPPLPAPHGDRAPTGRPLPRTAPAPRPPTASARPRPVPTPAPPAPVVLERSHRVRSALGLLGVAVLVGTVVAGLITVAIFAISVALRRAVG